MEKKKGGGKKPTTGLFNRFHQALGETRGWTDREDETSTVTLSYHEQAGETITLTAWKGKHREDEACGELGVGGEAPWQPAASRSQEQQ